jgi:hypothetical protein
VDESGSIASPTSPRAGQVVQIAERPEVDEPRDLHVEKRHERQRQRGVERGSRGLEAGDDSDQVHHEDVEEDRHDEGEVLRQVLA